MNEPGAILLWEAGWASRKRPALAELIARMTGTDSADRNLIQLVIDDFNSVVHADPQGSKKFILDHPELGRIYSPGRTVGAEDMADNVASAAAMAVTFLESNAKRAFQGRVVRFANRYCG